MLPPIEKIPAKIEELTGITDEFLRKGGFDSALGVERNGPASGFREVFTAFQTFCESKAQGRPVCLVAHNAKFDIRMIESELRRWRIADGQDRDKKNTAPVLGEVFDMSLDTLRLFKDPQFWRSTFENPNSPQRPSSFGLADLHRHVINESVENSHNAVGDIIALERLLLSESFNGWKRVATDIQTPFIDPLIAVKKYRQ